MRFWGVLFLVGCSSTTIVYEAPEAGPVAVVDAGPDVVAPVVEAPTLPQDAAAPEPLLSLAGFTLGYSKTDTDAACGINGGTPGSAYCTSGKAPFEGFAFAFEYCAGADASDLDKKVKTIHGVGAHIDSNAAQQVALHVRNLYGEPDPYSEGDAGSPMPPNGPALPAACGASATLDAGTPNQLFFARWSRLNEPGIPHLFLTYDCQNSDAGGKDTFDVRLERTCL